MEYLKNKYSEVELIKKNNWADIYVAINNETHDKVQLRILKSQIDNTEYINSITDEIYQLQNLRHKNLIGINGIYNFIENNTTYYYVETEYFKGKTLIDKMILTGHTCKESLDIIKQVAEGLNEFHYRGLNYETLSAENIFINSQGAVKIDVLSYIQQKHDEEEEYDNYDKFEDGIDKDIYAIGIILYQLITRDQDFKLRKLKKKIEDDEVYSMLYALTSKNTKYRYENLNIFLSDVNEHLQYLSFDGNQDIDQCESEFEDEYEYEEYDDEGNKSVLIKRLCACLAVVLVAFGGIKVMALVKKDNDKNETTIEMTIDKESTDTEDLAEEDQSDEPQVESTDNTTINNTTANTNSTYKENTNTVQNTNNTNTNNNSSGNSTSGSQVTASSGSGSTTKPGTTGSTSSGSGSTTTKPETGSTGSESGSENQGSTGSTGSESESGNQGSTGSTGSESESGNQETGSTDSENGSGSQGTEGIQIESETVETQSLEQYQIIEQN